MLRSLAGAPRHIVVNESDQVRVSDSGAIRSRLVPQLKHSPPHRVSTVAFWYKHASLARRIRSEQGWRLVSDILIRVAGSRTLRLRSRLLHARRDIRGSLLSLSCAVAPAFETQAARS